MTRLYNNVVSCRLIRIKNKTQYLRQNLLSMLCIFLFGFLSGNLFGTILNNLRNCVKWDGFIIFGLILKIEAISYFSYKSTVFDIGTNSNSSGIKINSKKLKNRFGLPFFFINSRLCAKSTGKTQFQANTLKKKTLLQQKSYKFERVFWNNLNLFKIGIMVGFFVDAFKVGS